MIVRPTRTHNSARTLFAAIAALGALAFAADTANAASQRVKNACKDDYFRFCPAYAPESAQMRQCMRSMGKRLSARCIDALADAGEIRRRKN